MGAPSGSRSSNGRERRSRTATALPQPLRRQGGSRRYTKIHPRTRRPGYRHRVSSLPASSTVASWCTLSANGQRARYGVSYVRNVCAQAGVGLNETSPDEDVLATDCEVVFAEGGVRVQVKCTSSFTLAGKTKSWKLKPEWLRKWDQSLVPVYFVIVVVPKSEPSWLTHPVNGTLHQTAAFWQRVPSAISTRTISVPRSQRLTASTMDTWHTDLLAVFSPAGAP